MLLVTPPWFKPLRPERLYLKLALLGSVGNVQTAVGIAVSEDFCSFPTTVYFYGWAEPYQAGRANIIGVEPFEVCRDVFSDGIDRDTYFIRVEAVLRINDDAQMSSEIVEACADPYSIDLEVEEDGSLFAYAGL